MDGRLDEALRAIVRDIVKEELAAATKPAPDELLDVHGARSRLGIARSTLYELLESGDLRSITIGRRRLIPSSAIAEYIAGR